MEKVRFKKYLLYDSIYIKLKMQTDIQCQKASQVVVGGRKLRRGTKNMYIFTYLDCSDAFTGAHMSKLMEITL